jgi:energy-coupling factor transporter ATP-binding protein EcfA2
MTMQITRLRIEQLRQFREPYELNDFEPGLNIFCGPNEAGKSTLVRAIRAVFFERHRSTSVDDLRPWGDSGAAPTIALDFKLASQTCQLGKSFLARKRCSLRIDSRTLEGPEAEDHLAELFGFAFAGKGASKSEHWGIPGLLWVEQGTGQEFREAAGNARNHLHDALHGQVKHSAAGALTASGGDELLDQLRAQRNELLTQAGKPRMAYAEVIEQVQSFTARQAELDGQIASYRQQVDQLSILRSQQLADDAAKPWAALRADLAAALQRQQTLQQSQKQLEDDRARHAALEQQRKLRLDQAAAFARQIEDATRREQVLATAAEQLAATQAAQIVARGALDLAQSRAVACRDAVSLARQEHTRATLMEQVVGLTSTSVQTGLALTRAETEQQRLMALQQTAAATVITTKDVAALRALDKTLRTVEARREAVATRLSFVLQSGQCVDLRSAAGIDRIEGVADRLLTTAVCLLIPGIGELTISPGGQDLGDLDRQLAAAQVDLQTALQGAGLSDLADAESRLTRHTEQLAQIKLAEQALSLTAPKGLDVLRQVALAASAAIGAAQQALEKLPPAPAPATSVLPLPQAEAEQEAANAVEQSAQLGLSLAQQQFSVAQAGQQAAERELAATRAVLADPQRQQHQTEAAEQLLATTAERDALASRIEQTRDALGLARPDIVAQDVVRLTQSIASSERAHQQRREQILVLENTLQQAGAQGLEEERASVAGHRVRAGRRCTELQRRAAALDLLCSKLDAKRQATLARLQAPLQHHLQRYLQLIFPTATLQIDEQLAPGTLTRQGAAGAIESGDVSALSFGAREQLGLITRFAYADLLRDAGRPTLLILDDALVHSDATRLVQMKRALFDAAQRHQVLVFTCHPEHWRDMGVLPRPISGVPAA